MAADHASARPAGQRRRRESRRSARTLPPVWHVGAVHDLVRLVAHPAQIVPAHRAWFPGAPVHGEVLAELGGESPAALAFHLEGVGEHIVDRIDQPAAFLVVELGQRRVGRELRAVQDVVGVPAAHTGDRSLVAQDRVDVAVVIARQEEFLGLGSHRLGAELVERPVVAGRQDPPARLALAARTPSRAPMAGR